MALKPTLGNASECLLASVLLLRRSLDSSNISNNLKVPLLRGGYQTYGENKMLVSTLYRHERALSDKVAEHLESNDLPKPEQSGFTPE